MIFIAQVTPERPLYVSRKVHHLDRLRIHMERTTANGGSCETLFSPYAGLYKVKAYSSGRCSSPVTLERTYRREAGGLFSERPFMMGGVHMTQEVRCRQCPECLAARASLWTARAREETRGSSRTWFGTFTLAPEHHSRAVMLADLILRKGGERFEDLSSTERFAWRHKVLSDEFTKYLKRVRKESGARLRYILVAEAHKSGLPHWHCLIHEVNAEQPVRHRVLVDQWRLGFTSFKLCEPDGVTYVTKYLSKCALARVRASVRYGQNALCA